MTNPVTPKPLKGKDLKTLRKKGIVLTEMDKGDKPAEEIMSEIVILLYGEKIEEDMTGGEILSLGSECIELTYGDSIEKKS